MKKGFTLAEILVVLVIIGILAALAWPNFTTTKEKTLDREAKATLALVRAAERIYRMEAGVNYYPFDSYTTTNNIGLINTNLKLSLPSTASPNWSYSIDNTASTGTGLATRTAGAVRTWKLDSAGNVEDPLCTGVCL